METATQFPVDTGTVVEVTCSYSDAVFEGDSQITCINGKDFTFSEEPSCKIPGEYNRKCHNFGASKSIIYMMIQIGRYIVWINVTNCNFDVRSSQNVAALARS